MWSFVSDNSGALNVVLNALMLVVWALYFQLLLSNFRRQRRARILINRGAGQTLDALCVVSNMSPEAIYLQTLLVRIGSDGKRRECSLSDLDSLAKEPDNDPRSSWFQGPIDPGGYLVLGSFGTLLQMAAENGTPGDDVLDLEAIEEFDITAVAVHGPDDYPVAARRRFVRNEAHRTTWRAMRTRQITSIFRRRRLRAHIDGY